MGAALVAPLLVFTLQLWGVKHQSEVITIVFSLPVTGLGIGTLTRSLPEGKSAAESLEELFLIS